MPRDQSRDGHFALAMAVHLLLDRDSSFLFHVMMLVFLPISTNGRRIETAQENITNTTANALMLETDSTLVLSTGTWTTAQIQNGGVVTKKLLSEGRVQRGVMSKLKSLWKDKTGKDKSEWDLSREEAAEHFEEYYKCLKKNIDIATSITNGIDMPVHAVLALEGETITLGCLVCIRPDQDKQSQQAVWQHLRRDDATMGALEFSERIFMTPQSGLVIKNTDVGDAGQYTCLHKRDYVAVYQVDIIAQERRKMVRLGEELQPEGYLLSHNLRLLTVWAPWGPCDACDVIGNRQRVGTCIVKKLEEDDKLRPRDFPMLDLYPDGVPCRSTALPGQLRRLTAVRQRFEETLVAECNVPCPTEPPPVMVTDNDGNAVEVVEPGKLFSLNNKPPIPQVTVRRVLYEPEGKHLVLTCGSESQRGTALRWMRGKRRVDPTSIRRQTQGRVWIDSANRLHLKDLLMSDTAVYNCWEVEVHVAAIKVLVVSAMNEKIKDYITYGGLAFTVLGSLVACCCVCRRQGTAK